MFKKIECAICKTKFWKVPFVEYAVVGIPNVGERVICRECEKQRNRLSKA